MNWYMNVNLKPFGPLSTQDVLSKIMSGEIGPHDLLSNADDGEWLAVSAFKEFRHVQFPAFQQFDAEATQATLDWVVLDFELKQQGPFSTFEVIQKIKNGQVCPEEHIWRAGLTGWAQVKDRPEFSGFI